MKYTIVASALAVFAPLVSADNCKKGLDYCGGTLLGIGFYDAAVEDALKAAGQRYDSAIWDLNIFHCDDDDGNIHFVEACADCRDGGAGNNDYCPQGLPLPWGDMWR